MATLTKGTTFASGDVVTPAKLNNLVDAATVTNIVNADVSNTAAIALSKLATGALPTGITVASANIADGTIVNADVSASAAIADTKLATISTTGKVSNSATTATNANTANAIVARDASRNFSAGTITANLTGNASTATTLQTARTIGGVSFNGSANINLPGVNTAGNQNTTGNAATASAWATGRNLSLTGDVTATLSSVNGSANVSAAATIANNAVTTAKIADGAVTNAKIDGSVGLNAWQTRTANYTAVAGDRINANTGGGAFTITLPATPADYTEVTIADHAGTWESNNLTVARNGSNINGGTANLTCDIAAKQILLRFEGATIGWRIYT